VVADDDRGLALWIAPGTAVAYEAAEDGRDMRAMSFAEWVNCRYRLCPSTWTGWGMLLFTPRRAAHSVWFRYGRAGRFDGWYVNLEEPAVRWDDDGLAGVDIVDQDLDLEIRPDRSWSWKDEDEFAERLRYPRQYWVTDGARVRHEGLRVARAARAGRFPFDGTWCTFRPDPRWPVPAELPLGSDRPPAPRSGTGG
jgi:predicted RNA-binding protein associated with RNAse of E/G family